MSRPCARPVEFWYAWVARVTPLSSAASSKPPRVARLASPRTPPRVTSLAARSPASLSPCLRDLLAS